MKFRFTLTQSLEIFRMEIKSKPAINSKLSLVRLESFATSIDPSAQPAHRRFCNGEHTHSLGLDFKKRSNKDKIDFENNWNVFQMSHKTHETHDT